VDGRGEAAEPEPAWLSTVHQERHGLEYADGTPYFLVGDTWLGAATWRLPLTEQPVKAGEEPGPGVTFQQAVAWRKGRDSTPSA